MVRPGMALGRFDLVEPVAEDAVTSIWRARARGTEEACTVEALAPDFAARLSARSAFLAAASALATVPTEGGVLRVLDVGEDAAEGVPFVATADDPGPTLVARLRARGPLGGSDVARIVAALAAALTPLHARGLAHGDLTARNVVWAEGTPAVAVRGFARGAVLAQLPATASGVVSAHLAPELRAAGGRPTAAADAYALGWLALTLLAGDEAVAAVEDPESAASRRPLSVTNPAVAARLPPGFDDWFLAVTSPDVGARSPFAAAAAELVAILAAELPGDPAAPPWAGGSSAAQGPAAAPTAPRRHTEKRAPDPEPRSPWEPPSGSAPAAPREGGASALAILGVVGGVAALLFAVLVVVGGVGFFLYQKAKSEAAVAAASALAASSAGAPATHAAARIPVGDDDPTQGNPDALVTVVVFSDLQCPFCAHLAPTFSTLRQEFTPAELRIVWKNKPLAFHKDARPAQEAAVATYLAAGGGADGSAAFFRFHNLAFANQRSLTPENFQTWAASAGVDVARYRVELASPRPRLKVDADIALGDQLGARGTPTSFVNGILMAGAQSAEKFRETIRTELAAAQQALAAGTPREQIYVERVAANLQAPPSRTTASPSAVAEDSTLWRVEVAPDDPVRGPPDALVTIVEWGDFQCPFCKRVAQVVATLQQRHPADVRLVWKDNPLDIHPDARPAAVLGRLAFARLGSTGFFRAHDALFATAPRLEEPEIARVAASLGLAGSELQVALQARTFDGKLAASAAEAADLDARATPHFFVNGYRVKGAQSLEKFEAVYAERRAVAEALVRAGVPRSKVYARIIADARRPPPSETKILPPPLPTNPQRGPADAPVVIQVFSDFQCPFCARLRPTLEQLQQTYPGKVRIVWRNFPLAFHQNAALAAEAAQEAFAQRGAEGFWRYHDALFAQQGQADGLARAALEQIAADQGLDLQRFSAALDSHVHRAVVDADVAVGRAAGIKGTPSMVIGQTYVGGAQPLAVLSRHVDRALAAR